MLNELLDAGPRPAAPGQEAPPGAAGAVTPALALRRVARLGARRASAWALLINVLLPASAALLWVMGIVYNVPPLRTKEMAVPRRAVRVGEQPDPAAPRLVRAGPTAFRRCRCVIAYWMVGAFFMAMKRFAEYRHIGDRATAAATGARSSTTPSERLLVSIIFYATACALFAGIFIVRYHLELILFAPLGGGHVRLLHEARHAAGQPGAEPGEALPASAGSSPTDGLRVAAFVLLMFVPIPALYELFNVDLGEDGAALGDRRALAGGWRTHDPLRHPC